jgi:hypothetical protein
MRLADYAIVRATAAPIGGSTFGCPDRSLSGFPLRIDVHCLRATYSNPGGTIAVALDGLWASEPLYRPAFVEASLDGPLQFDMVDRGVALTAQWSAATATVSAWIDGSYRLTVNAQHINVKPADGAVVPELEVRANVAAQGVGWLGTDPAAGFLKWARNGGKLKIDDLRIAVNDAVVTASGTLSLNKDGLLNGSILFGYNSIDALANLIEMFRPGTKAKYAQPLQIVNSLTREVKTEDGTLRQTSITFTDGVIWLAFLPLPIDPVPPIKF